MTVTSDQGRQIHRAKGTVVRLSLAKTLSTNKLQYDLGQFHPNFEGENPGGGERLPSSIPLPPTSGEDLLLLHAPHAMRGTLMS
ncbi:hypothetical protein TNCV_4579631 [Trichonephila clavipes]|nr:hypothetical protein TNCV_4579631 [Trichonephila clavipes]